MNAPRSWGPAIGTGGTGSQGVRATAKTLRGVSYEILGKIGEGTYGVVYLIRYNDRKRSKVAVKTFKVSSSSSSVDDMTKTKDSVPLVFI